MMERSIGGCVLRIEKENEYCVERRGKIILKYRMSMVHL